MILRIAPPEHWCWIAERAQLVIGHGFGVVEAIEDLHGAEGPVRILAQVAFDGWTANSVSLSVAVEEPIALRRLLRQCFGMAFLQYGKGVVTAMVVSTNARSLALVKHLGYREVYRGRDWWAPGVDMVIFEMRREECRFIDRSNGASAATENVPREEAA